MAAIRKRYDDQIALGARLGHLPHPQGPRPEGDEMLYREMQDRYGKYFKGDMGAEAIQKRLQTST
jgi:DNA-directed RNA polymerase subunit beta'